MYLLDPYVERFQNIWENIEGNFEIIVLAYIWASFNIFRSVVLYFLFFEMKNSKIYVL